MKTDSLLTWIGQKDLDASESDSKTDIGPIGQAVKKHEFSHIWLLSNYDVKEIIKKGYGHAYTKYPYDSNKQSEFRAAETYAKESKSGLWKNQNSSQKNYSKSHNDKLKSFLIDQANKNKYSSSGNKGKTYVKGYTRSDGTKVSEYWRSKPSCSKSGSYGGGSSSSSRSSSSSGNKGKIYIESYNRSNGTKVRGHWRSKPSRSSRSSSYSGSSSSSRSSSGGGRVSVSGYTRSNGTYVRGYTRSAPSRGSKK